MDKRQLIRNFTFPLIILGILLAICAYVPILRFVLGFDSTITLPFSTTLIFLIAGYMSGLAGLIAWAKQSVMPQPHYQRKTQKSTVKPYWLSLSLLIPVPFISCIVLLWFWQRERHQSIELDMSYRDSINFHLSLHLYFLLSFFLTPLAIGFLIIFMFLIVYVIATIWCLLKPGSRYPVNIRIVPVDKDVIADR